MIGTGGEIVLNKKKKGKRGEKKEDEMFKATTLHEISEPDETGNCRGKKKEKKTKLVGGHQLIQTYDGGGGKKRDTKGEIRPKENRQQEGSHLEEIQNTGKPTTPSQKK